MDLGKSKNCRMIAGCIKHAFLFGLASHCFAESNYSATHYPIHSFSTPFSKDIALIDQFTQKKQSKLIDSPRPDMSLRFGPPITEKKVGSFLYKAIDDPKRFAETAAATTIFTTLDAIGVSESVKAGVNYIKEKTRYQFGKCGKVRLSSKVRAESCLTDQSSVELQSDYTLNAVSLSFRWSL